MCRIAGLINKRLSGEEIKHKVQAMCDSLQHGGPDDEGVYYDAVTNTALGNRRLSIIDLSTNGHMPMADVDKKAWITFNGEIYNYRELKKELIALGAKFSSDTDTEVILQAYLFWGTQAFTRLRGMFAFALYDAVKQRTLLVRDTNGIKQLYYYINDGQLAFASEIRALKKAGIATTPDPNWPIWLLALGNIPEPHTTLKGVLNLPKGHFLTWQNDGTYKIESYLQDKKSNYITNEKDATQRIAELLKQAVSRQLIADAPIGVFLSGGIDSSLLTLLADKQKKDGLKSLSVFFNEDRYDERMYQDVVSDKTDCKNYKFLVQQQDFEDVFPDILKAMDMPTTDGINTWFISKYAHQAGLKAVLSGIGADELFGGYPSFNRIKYLPYLRKLPTLFSSVISIANNRFKKFEYLKNNHPLADYLFLRGLYNPTLVAQILDTTEQDINNTLFGSNNFPDLGNYNKQHAAWFENNLYMQNQLLRDTDVMSMNHSLEVRVPFLDEDFKAFIETIHPDIRFSSKQPKKILIDSFKNLLPETVWNRPKMGFTFPLQQWMINNEAIRDESIYKTTQAKKLIRKFKTGELHWSRAYALYQVQTYV
ncbi:asparagine synthase (glutamine-hydrolyzing) [Inquilinus sp. KBS0705]|nr:asparagine synthase (glutamine-hydrolyzing) [Inquilinus sp. KBS0705]